MRQALRLSNAAVFHSAMEKSSWVKNHFGKGWFIPVGSILPTDSEANSRMGFRGRKISVAVFGITGGDRDDGKLNIVEARAICRSSPRESTANSPGPQCANAEAE